jgi:hypothetical protein
MTPARFWAWLTQRKPWTPLGGLPEYLELSPRAQR